MSLDFDFTAMIERLGQEEFDRITDHPTIKGDWHPVTSALIWATLSVGFGSITDENADTFANRLLALQAISGGDILTDEGRIVVTREDVHRHIGMRTNVTTMRVGEFNKRLAQNALEVGSRMERKQKASAFDRIAEGVNA